MQAYIAPVRLHSTKKYSTAWRPKPTITRIPKTIHSYLTVEGINSDCLEIAAGLESVSIIIARKDFFYFSCLSNKHIL